MVKYKYVAMDAIHEGMLLLFRTAADLTPKEISVPRQNFDSLARKLGYTDAKEVFDLVEAYERAAGDNDVAEW